MGTHAVCTVPPGRGERGLARKGWLINCSTVYRCDGSGQQQAAMNDLASGDMCLAVWGARRRERRFYCKNTTMGGQVKNP